MLLYLTLIGLAFASSSRLEEIRLPSIIKDYRVIIDPPFHLRHQCAYVNCLNPPHATLLVCADHRRLEIIGRCRPPAILLGESLRVSQAGQIFPGEERIRPKTTSLANTRLIPKSAWVEPEVTTRRKVVIRLPAISKASSD